MNNRLKICIDHNFLGSGINYKRQWEDSQERQQRKNKSHLGLQENVSIYEDIRFHHITYISTSPCFITWISKCSETANQIYYKTNPILSNCKILTDSLVQLEK